MCFLHKIQNKGGIDTPIDKIMTKYHPSQSTKKMSCQLFPTKIFQREYPKYMIFFFLNNIQNLKLKNCFKVDLFYSFFFGKAQLHNLSIPNVDVLLCNRRIHHFSPSSIIISTASSIYFAPTPVDLPLPRTISMSSNCSKTNDCFCQNAFQKRKCEPFLYVSMKVLEIFYKMFDGQ